MATASALFKVPLLSLGHHDPRQSAGCHRFPRPQRVQLARTNFDSSFGDSSASSSSSSRCGCSALGLPSLSPLGSLGAWQQQNSFALLDKRLNLCGWKAKKAWRNSGMVIQAGMKLDPGGGGDGNGIGRTIVNLALAGGLTYLTVTGKLGWVFDTIISLWLLAVLLPIVGVIAFLWFAEREVITGACPNCGQSFQVFEFAVKEEAQYCPYCSQPFKLEDGKFIRDEPRFSSQRTNPGGFGGGFKSPFGAGFGRDTTSSTRKDESQEPGGIIVDVEAEVRDRD
ncbi:hypothetical protein MPTK1_6g13110 [Marchantia polymorpha subsp. ruderalis]|uniref:Uncharacterized protein n=2 Tax=Marchantia polymorpha TaxID=3197 RepID=A0A176W970_MARPO|nr:hypothetical protein AXG93_2789s1230 [Marchantia polymorpha subsp. ruderalis]PTQ37091.1 hypothetical protein MARPO_0059s0039 [Marchantia polymorpha]BBN14632.1 hypothetical protein Mp_6g13110 [Marchantia polymorpha subsp. ruderalis]|eukprot:PTQ37091.1 hypothetical protein MARPO_0059s0039 [Marchantia polymorpha]